MQSSSPSLLTAPPPLSNRYSFPATANFSFFLRHRPKPLSSSLTPTRSTMSSASSCSATNTPSSSSTSTATTTQTLLEFVSSNSSRDDLTVLVAHLQYACKRIACAVASPFFGSSDVRNAAGTGRPSSGSGRDDPKPLDLVSNDIILSSLRSSGKVAVLASEEDEVPVWMTDHGPFVVVTDPLDGSRNIDASIPTGTIFGIYNRLAELDHLPVEEKAQLNSLQSGTGLVAAAYVLYSSATIMCISFGSGTHAFTLDHSTGEFVLTHPCIQIPPRDQKWKV